MSILMAKIVQLKKCVIYMTEIIETAREQLQCKLPGAPKCLCCLLLVQFILTLASQVFAWILLPKTVE
jgi:hypothetical protein